VHVSGVPHSAATTLVLADPLTYASRVPADARHAIKVAAAPDATRRSFDAGVPVAVRAVAVRVQRHVDVTRSKVKLVRELAETELAYLFVPGVEVAAKPAVL
jgi:hypothetical protein